MNFKKIFLLMIMLIISTCISAPFIIYFKNREFEGQKKAYAEQINLLSQEIEQLIKEKAELIEECRENAEAAEAYCKLFHRAEEEYDKMVNVAKEMNESAVNGYKEIAESLSQARQDILDEFEDKKKELEKQPSFFERCAGNAAEIFTVRSLVSAMTYATYSLF